MNRIVSDNAEKIQRLCDEYKVKSLFAFGSVCTDAFSDSSDIDLIISFDDLDPGEYADNYFEIADKFENIFHRHVDLVTDKSLSNPYFISSINKTRVQIYG